MDYSKIKFTEAPKFDFGQYSSPRNTVYSVSSSIIKGKQPVIGDALELNFPKLEKPEVETPKPKEMPKKIKVMKFMGKEIPMEETILKNEDGSATHFYSDGKNGILAIQFDKNGKPISLSEENISGSNYKKSIISYKNDGTLQSEIITKNLSTNATRTHITNMDVNGKVSDEKIIENKDGVETETSTVFDEAGNTIKTLETITDDKTSRTTSEEINPETDDLTVQSSVYNLATSSETTRVEKTDKDGKLLYASDTLFENGQSRTDYEKYDTAGNLIGEGFQSIDTKGFTKNERVEYDASTGLYVEEKGSYDAEGVGTKTLVKTDGQGNVVSESTYESSADGYRTQTYKEYNENNEIIVDNRSETGHGAYISEEAHVDEKGQVQNETTMIINGKKYTDRAEFEKALKSE